MEVLVASKLLGQLAELSTLNKTQAVAVRKLYPIVLPLVDRIVGGTKVTGTAGRVVDPE